MKSNVVSALVVAVASFVVMSTPTFANGGGNKKVSLTEEQVNVKYVGSDDNNVIFKVEFENPTAEKFWLIIKNESGEVVYHRQFNDAHFSKNIIFQKEGDIQPTFVIRNSNNEVVRQFSVNTTVTENTTVTAL